MRYLLIILVFLQFSCSSDSDFKKGKKVLKQQGYKNIINTGYKIFCCSQDDTFSTGFEAVDKQGNTVEGCICSSIGKGITIRFN